MQLRTVCGALCVAACLGSPLSAEGMMQHPDTTPPPVQLERTQQRVLRSARNGVAYKLYVSLPPNYDAARRRYPVVYLLDADYSFAIARNIVDHLVERGDLPGLILVGIAYDGPPQYHLNRTRDYTPTNVPDWGALSGGYGPEVQRSSGGAQKFRSFIEQELIPFIDSSYATSPGDRCLVGHSFGGLFAVWNLVSTPSLFRRYIVVSPSLWYDGHVVLRRATDEARTPDSTSVHMYLGVGAREQNSQTNMVGNLDSLAVLLRSGHWQGLLFREDVLDGETHNSVFPRALSNGLRFVFDRW